MSKDTTGELGSLAQHDSFGINLPVPFSVGRPSPCKSIREQRSVLIRESARRKTMWVNPLLAWSRNEVA